MASALDSAEPKGRLHMQRDGNRVISFGLANEMIMFRDSNKLFSEGSSLASIIKSTRVDADLGMSKGIFPFGWLDSMQKLSRSRPPRDAAYWTSELSNKKPTQPEVDAVFAEWDAHGCRSVEECLSVYLAMDVKCLHAALNRHFASLEELMSLHPLDCRKMTISSIAFEGFLGFLTERKRPALFSPTHPSLFSHLKNGSLGGLTQASKSEASGLPDEPPLNDHLEGKLGHLERISEPPRAPSECCAGQSSLLCHHQQLEALAAVSVAPPEDPGLKFNRKAAGVHYFDVGSLYATSSKLLFISFLAPHRPDPVR